MVAIGISLQYDLLLVRITFGDSIDFFLVNPNLQVQQRSPVVHLSNNVQI